jgi:hypothetical protein
LKSGLPNLKENINDIVIYLPLVAFKIQCDKGDCYHPDNIITYMWFLPFQIGSRLDQWERELGQCYHLLIVIRYGLAKVITLCSTYNTVADLVFVIVRFF